MRGKGIRFFTALLLIMALSVNGLYKPFTDSAPVVHAESVNSAKDDCMTLYYEYCEEEPECDWSYFFDNVKGEAMPYFFMKAEPVNESGLTRFFLKSAANGDITCVKGDDLQYGRNYVMVTEFFLKYKGVYRLKTSLYKLSGNKVIKYHSTKMIKGKTVKKMMKNWNKWLTKTIHDSRGVRFKYPKWKY